MLIGLLLVNEENDILEETLANQAQYVDEFYALDGTVPNDDSREIIESFPECSYYMTDAELSSEYPDEPRCGYRQAIYEKAVADHGSGNWFMLMHGDEWWETDPREMISANPGIDGFWIRCPFYFPREGEPWDDDRGPIEQLHWHCLPGWVEFRLFRGNPGVHWDPGAYMSPMPQGLGSMRETDYRVWHYLYRSPESQRARANRRKQMDPDNYRHIVERDAVYWTDAMVQAVMDGRNYDTVRS